MVKLMRRNSLFAVDQQAARTRFEIRSTSTAHRYESDMKGHHPSSDYIQFSGICFRHAEATTDALDNLTLSIAESEFVCLLGPSGCGKTTVLNLLAGFETPTSGRITLAGTEVLGPGSDRSVVFQGDASLYHWLTARENVELGLRIARMPKQQRTEVASRYLRLVGLDGQGDKYPSQLSGGMKQRVNIARALAGDARVLLMDEPFGQVDAQTRTLLQDQLTSIWMTDRRTVFFVTHDIVEAICLADKIVIMRRGPKSRVKDVVPCELPRPRDRADPEFGRLYTIISRSIAEEVRGE